MFKIKINEPLCRGLTINDDATGKLWVEIKYERLPDFCYYCGLIGHNEGSCSLSTQSEKPEKLFGSWMRAATPTIQRRSFSHRRNSMNQRGGRGRFGNR